jgi:AcrR family transcriptional regulator
MTLTRQFLGDVMDEVKPRRSWTQREDSGRARRAEETRRALIAAGRDLFTEHGYHGVGVRDITARAGVTRGALAHHFTDKQGLFLAVFDAIERELIAAGAEPPPSAAPSDAWAQFRAGIQAYLDAALRPDVQRITLIDGPAVLGWRRWREIEEGYSLGSLIAVLNAAMDAKLIRRRSPEPLAHLILGSVMEAALLIAHSDASKRRRAEVGEALDDLLRGLE